MIFLQLFKVCVYRLPKDWEMPDVGRKIGDPHSLLSHPFSVWNCDSYWNSYMHISNQDFNYTFCLRTHPQSIPCNSDLCTTRFQENRTLTNNQSDNHSLWLEPECLPLLVAVIATWVLSLINFLYINRILYCCLNSYLSSCMIVTITTRMLCVTPAYIYCLIVVMFYFIPLSGK